jgi:protoheme IX farnesyltransferase
MDPQITITDPRDSGGGRREVIKAYVGLTKPRIIELLLITTVPAMAVAAGGWPNTWLVLWTLIGGTLSAGGANALNSYHDRDIDQVMKRTSRRPLPNHRVPESKARAFGWILGGLGFLVLWVSSNLLAAAISTAALLFYVFVYTLLLKRTSVQNIVIGGAAGAAPVLVGWAAVTGSLAVPAWVMFAIVFAWTPPHFWALAVRYKDDYAAAGVPMLPVVSGITATTQQMMVYTGITALFSLLLVPVVPMGWIYLVASVATGAWFMAETVRTHLRPERAMKLFDVSTIYLTVLFAAMLVDALVTG